MKTRWKSISLLAVLLITVGASLEAQRRGGPPRRIENPEPIQLESGARVDFETFESAALAKEMRYSIFLPKSYANSPAKHYPVVYFLHGMNNDDTSWCVDRYGNLPARLDGLMTSSGIPEFIMVNPQGERGFYTDSADGQRKYEEYIRRDLVAEVESKYRVAKESSKRAIGGTSMGGYGSLKIAFRYPEMFGTALGGSPIVLLGDDPSKTMASASPRAQQFFTGLFGQVYGDPFDVDHWKANSLEYLAQTAPIKDMKVGILYGTADRYNGMIPMEQGIRRLDEILTGRGVSTELKIYEEGPHGWGLISEHFEEAVRFLSQDF